ncbi:class II aldolase/adducin family protein [Microbacterium sp. NPDC096154]|uniref:class II aldolase/adducin family protein n=1 Tax=Microbacterium sp. NPDC096154 TaxID=3155549 RepID=UPI0033255EC0
MLTHQEGRALVAEAGRILSGLGLIDYLGHASLRVEGGAIIKPKHSPTIRDASRLGPEHMVHVDLDGQLLEGQDPPPSEVFIHTEIYRARPDVGAVVHTHQKAATMLGVLDAPILPILHIPASYVERVEMWPHAHLVADRELGSDLARALGDASFCHLQGHGIVSVAPTLQEAVVGAVMVEELAVANLEALRAGLAPRVIPDDELADLRRLRGGIEGRWQYLREQFG